jgi:hypothetical protein
MKLIGKIVSALLIGISLSFYYWIGSFVLSQSQSILRNLELDPSNLKVYIPLGVAIGAIIFWFIKTSVKSFLIISLVLFAISLLLWLLVSSPDVQQYLMPPMLR